MVSKNILTDGKYPGIAGGLLSVVSVFLPWFSGSGSAGILGLSSSISVNGLGWKKGEGLLLGLFTGNANWGLFGVAILALGIASILIAVLLKDKIQSLALLECGLLILGGGIVNLWSMGSLSGEFMGATMQSGAGFGLYVVMLGGAVTTSGGLITWRNLNN